MDLSDYGKQLSQPDLQQYMQKIAITKMDPYSIDQKCPSDIGDFPKILYPDICMYLVNTKSRYMMEKMRAYKSLEAYNQAACGWVRNMVKKLDKHSPIVAKEMHSQKLREKHLSVWILAEDSGQIETAHCDCVAGFSDVCSHVAAVLFVIDNAIHVKNWYEEMPSNKPAEPKHIGYIDFTIQKKYCRAIITPQKGTNIMIPPLSTAEHQEFLNDPMVYNVITLSHLVTQPVADSLKGT